MYGMFSSRPPVLYAQSVNRTTGRRTLVLKWGEKTFEALVPKSRYQEQRVLAGKIGGTLQAVIAEFSGRYSLEE